MKSGLGRMVASATTAAVAVSLTGCAVSSGGSQSGGDTKVLTVWSYFAGDYPGMVAAKVQDKLFEKANPGWTVKQVTIPGPQLDQKLLATASTGNGPDVLFNNFVVDFPELAAAGVMKDLTNEWNSYPDKGQFPAASVLKAKGKVYTILSYTNLIGLYYNKDILNQYGIAPPTTVEELETALGKIKAGGKYQGLAESGSPQVEGAWLFMPLLLSQGVNYCNFEGSKVEDAFKRVANWAKQGYIPQATATWVQSDAWQKFMTGKFAFGINGNWQLGGAKKNAKFAYGTGQFPTIGGSSVVFPGGEGMAIGAHSQHPEMAWKYLQQAWLSKDASLALFEAGGSIPTRSDVASLPKLASDALVQPFVKAAQTSGTWPNNPSTADMQTALGKAVSAVISGQMTAEQGAQTAVRNIQKARKAGGGGC